MLSELGQLKKSALKIECEMLRYIEFYCMNEVEFLTNHKTSQDNKMCFWNNEHC